MSYLPQLRGELVQAAERLQADAAPTQAAPVSGGAVGVRRAGRWPAVRRWRWAALNVAIGLAGTILGLGAAGVFKRGTALGPTVAPVATADEGVAIPRSVRLLALRVADPGGGLPWGLRVERTTRGLTCVDVGRVDFATIGVLGRDGAFGDDGRFHPISDEDFFNLGCAVTDARGHGFVNVSMQNVPASALHGEARSAGGCRLAEEAGGATARFIQRSRESSRTRATPTPTCPAGDEREIYFGLLGPDARSITYRVPGGGLRTIPTVGPQGAYLLVLRQATSGCLAPAPLHGRHPQCSYSSRGDSGGPEVPAGAIAEVHYSDGHTCHVAAPGTFASLFGSCRPVGFVAPRRRKLTSAQLRMPISVRELPASSYCTKGEVFVPCGHGVPAGASRLPGGEPSLLVQISFTSRVAIANGASWYEIELSYPRSRACAGGGSGQPTSSDIHVGERVSQRTFVPYRCPGVVHGTVDYVPTVGAAGAMPVTGLPGQGKPVLVGRFSFKVNAPAR